MPLADVIQPWLWMCLLLWPGFVLFSPNRPRCYILHALQLVCMVLTLPYYITLKLLFSIFLLLGLATGSFCVIAPMYISEIAEDSIRGSLGTLFQLLLSVGILLVYIIGALVSWTTLSVLCLMVPLGLFVGMIFLPETPTYLLKKVGCYAEQQFFIFYMKESNKLHLGSLLQLAVN